MVEKAADVQQRRRLRPDSRPPLPRHRCCRRRRRVYLDVAVEGGGDKGGSPRGGELYSPREASRRLACKQGDGERGVHGEGGGGERSLSGSGTFWAVRFDAENGLREYQ